MSDTETNLKGKGPERKVESPESLKERFLAGKIRPRRFLDLLLEADQADPHRSAAPAALAVLEDPAVKQKFAGTKEEKRYLDLCGFESFHIGQIKCMEGDEADGLLYFIKSLGYAELAGSRNPEWDPYVKGTIAYLRGDAAQLQKYIDEMIPCVNRIVLQRLLDGLKTRGAPLYREDY